jgi:hypothetical protein
LAAADRGCSDEGKVFFFEKKKQKTFAHLSVGNTDSVANLQSLFASFSSEKEDAFPDRRFAITSCSR